jgi:hypothetical protein
MVLYTLYGTGASKTIANRTLTLTAGSGTDAKVKINKLGSAVADFEAEYDTVIRTVVGTSASFVYRTTYWADVNNTFGYGVDISSTFVRLVKAGNSATPSWSSIAAPAAVFTAGSTVHVKVIVRGTNHKVLVDGVQYINSTDATYSTGGVGFRSYDGASVFSAFKLKEMLAGSPVVNDLLTSNGADNDFNASTGWTLSNATVAGGVLTLDSTDGVTPSTAAATCTVACSNITVGGTSYTEHWRVIVCARYKDATGSAGTLTVTPSGSAWTPNPATFTVSTDSLLPTQAGSFREFATTEATGTAADGNDLSSSNCPTSVTFTLSTLSTRPIEVEWVKIEPVENNRFKYKMTLNSDAGHTQTPKIENVLFINTTDSDTGISEGHIDEFNNPLVADDTIGVDLGRKSRDDCIGDIQKLTAQDMWIDNNGLFQCYNQRGTVTNRIFAIGKDIMALNVKNSREPMANILTLIGSGQVSQNMSIEVTSNQKDDPSIALYGPIEKTITEKGITNQPTANLRCKQVLRQLCVPQQTVTATVIDSKVNDWEIGDTVYVSDPTGTTGVLDLPLRVSKETRTYNINGEQVQLEFSNVNNDIKAGFNAIIDRMDDYMNREQAGIEPMQVSFVDNCDASKPCKALLTIDDTRKDQVQDILLYVYSEKFRAFETGAAAESTHTHGIAHTHGISHTHGIGHDHTINVPGHKHAMGQYNWGGFSGVVSDWTVNSSTSGGGVAAHTHNIYGITVTGETQDATSNTSGASSQSSSGASSQSSSGASSETSTAAGSSHTHPPVFGIYEYPGGSGGNGYAPCKMYINDDTFTTPFAPFGIQGSYTSAFQVLQLSLLGSYAADNSKVLKPGVNWIYIQPIAHSPENPSGLIRIYIDVRIIYKS